MDVKSNIANNIVELRKSKKWTQAELAEKLNYTDKAISKWERGESTPDVDVIYKMSEIFDVTVDYFFHEDSFKEINKYKVSKENLVKSYLILSLVNTAIWFLAILVFIYGQTDSPKSGFWLSFIYPVPITILVTFLHLRKTGVNSALPYIFSSFLWTLIVAIYLQLFVLGNNFWLIFIIGVPLQIAIVLISLIKK